MKNEIISTVVTIIYFLVVVFITLCCVMIGNFIKIMG